MMAVGNLITSHLLNKLQEFENPHRSLILLLMRHYSDDVHLQ